MKGNEIEYGQCVDLGISKERVAPIVNILVCGRTEEYREQVWKEKDVTHYFFLSRTQVFLGFPSFSWFPRFFLVSQVFLGFPVSVSKC